MRASGILFVLIIAIFLFSPTNAFSQKKPAPPNLPSIEKVTIADDVIETICPYNPSFVSASETAKQETLVSTRVANPAPGLKYYYSVTGSQIVGEGPTVGWNLEGLRPGQYKITVGIGRKGVIIGDVVSQIITVIEFRGCCMVPCDCTNITEVIEPEGPVKTGDIIVVSAKLAGRVDVKFKWEVEGGQILSSLENETVMIKVTAKPGEIVNVYAELKGNREDCGCLNRAGTHVRIE